jgi:hypothetical protein
VDVLFRVLLGGVPHRWAWSDVACNRVQVRRPWPFGHQWQSVPVPPPPLHHVAVARCQGTSPPPLHPPPLLLHPCHLPTSLSSAPCVGPMLAVRPGAREYIWWSAHCAWCVNLAMVLPHPPPPSIPPSLPATAEDPKLRAAGNTKQRGCGCLCAGCVVLGSQTSWSAFDGTQP